MILLAAVAGAYHATPHVVMLLSSIGVLAAGTDVRQVVVAEGALLASLVLMGACGRPLLSCGYRVARGGDDFRKRRYRESEAVLFGIGLPGTIVLGIFCNGKPATVVGNPISFTVFALLPALVCTGLAVWWVVVFRGNFRALRPALRGRHQGGPPQAGSPWVAAGRVVAKSPGAPVGLLPVFGTRTDAKVFSRTSRRVTFSYRDTPIGRDSFEVETDQGRVEVAPGKAEWSSTVQSLRRGIHEEVIVEGARVLVLGRVEAGGHASLGRMASRGHGDVVLFAASPDQDPVAWLRGARWSGRVVPLVVFLIGLAASGYGLHRLGVLETLAGRLTR